MQFFLFFLVKKRHHTNAECKVRSWNVEDAIPCEKGFCGDVLDGQGGRIYGGLPQSLRASSPEGGA